jgi:hypothetical protein
MLKVNIAENVGEPDEGKESRPERLRFPPFIKLWLIEAYISWVITVGKLKIRFSE